MGAALVNQQLKSPAMWFFLLLLLAAGDWAFLPTKLSPPPALRPAQFESRSAKDPVEHGWSEADLRGILSKQLRKPQPIQPKAVVLPELPKPDHDPPRITLIVTMIGNGDASAVVRDPKGKVTRSVVGDHIAGAIVRDIRPGEIDVEFEGTLITISVESTQQERGRSGG